MNSRDITVYLDERWCKALEAHTGLAMESLLSGQMDALIQELPKDQREQIVQEIHQEEQEQARVAEANRRFSITRITENGESRYCLLERGEIMFQTAQRLRRYLRGELDDPSHFYGDAWPITQEEMERHTAELLRGSPRVVGIYDIDLDAGEVYSLDFDKGWQGYQIKDVSTAVYFATKRESDSWSAMRNRFNQRLEEKEINNDVRQISIRGQEKLPLDSLCFNEDIQQLDHLLNFCIPISFDSDKVLGFHVDLNDGFPNVYANYDMAKGCVSETLWVYLWKDRGMVLECEYRLTPEEQEAIRAKMDTYCMAQRGLSLETAREQYLAEEQVPTGQEPPQQATPTLQM